MQPKIYRNASWKNIQLVFSAGLFVVMAIIFPIAVLTSRKPLDTNTFILVEGILVGFIILALGVGRISGVIVDDKGITSFGLHKKRHIQWEEIKEIACLAVTQYYMKQIPLEDIPKRWYYTRIIYLLPENVSPMQVKRRDKFVTFPYRKDVFEEVLLTMNRYYKSKD